MPTLARLTRFAVASSVAFTLLAISIPMPAAAQESNQLASPLPADTSISGPVQEVAEAAVQPFVAGAGGQRMDRGVPLVLRDPHYYLVSGQETGGQWVYPYVLHVTGSDTLSSIEVARNSTTHTDLIEVGVPTTASLALVPHVGSAGTRSANGPGSTSSPAPAQAQNKFGHFETVWHDFVPVTPITVNAVDNSISFNYDGIEINYYTSGWGHYELSQDGWFMQSGTMYMANAPDWSWASSASPVEDENERFCAVFGGGTTFVNYNTNAVFGYKDGSISGDVNTWASGGCTSPLSYYTILGS